MQQKARVVFSASRQGAEQAENDSCQMDFDIIHVALVAQGSPLDKPLARREKKRTLKTRFFGGNVFLMGHRGALGLAIEKDVINLAEVRMGMRHGIQRLE